MEQADIENVNEYWKSEDVRRKGDERGGVI